VSFLVRYTKRLKNILRWLASGQYGRLGRALKDQIGLKKALAKRLWRSQKIVPQSLLTMRQRARVRRSLARVYNYQPASDTNARFQVAVIARDAYAYPRSSTFIRLVSPLTDPSVSDHIALTLYPENTVNVKPGTNVIIVQRTAFDDIASSRKLAANIEANQAHLIIDNDDAFHFIDESHPEYAAQKRRVEALDYLLTKADQIWLSVPALKPTVAAATGKVVVVSNCLDKRVWTQAKKPAPLADKQAPIRLLYMGTGTHDADFQMILPALDAVAAKHPGAFTLTIVGVAEDLPDRPWLERLYQSSTTYPLFWEWFLAKGPFDVGLSPLVDSEFNRAKSDIKCLDYLAMGVVPAVSDVLPYQVPEINDFIIKVKNTPPSWTQKLSDIVENPEAFRRRATRLMPKAKHYVWEKRSSKSAAAQVLKLLEELK
jgi:hypothetical protein